MGALVDGGSARLQGDGPVLITGATGFLGQHLTRALQGAGVAPGRLRLMGRRFADPEHQLAAAGARLVEGSLLDEALLADAVAGCTLVFHLAGQVSRRREDARQLHRLHVDGTRLLCQLLTTRAPTARLVLASTSGTIAVSHRRCSEVVTLCDESAAYPVEAVGRWPYYLSKIYQEQTALGFHRQHGLDVVVGNPSLLLGPGDTRDSSTGDVLAFLRRQIPAVPEGGMSFVDVRDAALAFVAAADRGRAGQRYLMGAANWTLAQFFGRLERQSGVAAPRLAVPHRLAGWMQSGLRALEQLGALGPLGLEDSAALDPVSTEMSTACWWFSSALAESELGFAPRDPGETLADTVRDLRLRHGLDAPTRRSDGFWADRTSPGGEDERFVPWAGAESSAPSAGRPGGPNPWQPRGRLGAKRRAREGASALLGSVSRRSRADST